MIRDLEEIRRRAALHEREDLDFRRALHNQPPPHHLLEEIAARVTAAIDCTECAACCHSTRLEMNEGDLVRIAEHLHMDAGAVRRLYTEPEIHGGGLLARQPGGGCVFLDGNLCIVYEARPRACREFPYLLSTATSLGHRMSSIFARAAYCPIVFNTLELLKGALGFHPKAAPPPA